MRQHYTKGNSMITAYANVEPNKRPAYVRLHGPKQTHIARNQETWFSFFDHTKDPRFTSSDVLHRTIDYWSYDYQREYYDLHFIDQKELEKDFSQRYRCSFEILRFPEFGVLEVAPWFPMYDKLIYRPGRGYEGKDSFSVRPIVPNRGYTGHGYTFHLYVGNPFT